MTDSTSRHPYIRSRRRITDALTAGEAARRLMPDPDPVDAAEVDPDTAEAAPARQDAAERAAAEQQRAEPTADVGTDRTAPLPPPALRSGWPDERDLTPVSWQRWALEHPNEANQAETWLDDTQPLPRPTIETAAGLSPEELAEFWLDQELARGPADDDAG